MFGRFSYLWTTAKVSDVRDMGFGCNHMLLIMVIVRVLEPLAVSK